MKPAPRDADPKHAGIFDGTQSARLVQAIAAAESGNRGEVRLHLEGRCKRDPLERAKRLFAELGMQKTRADTGVLLYVAVEDRKAAVFAGKGIHGAAAPDFWKKVVDGVAQGFKENKPLDGLLEALEQIGDLLREHAAGDDHANELPDQVSMS
jgi:uncharacterized membrane protein